MVGADTGGDGKLELFCFREALGRQIARVEAMR